PRRVRRTCSEITSTRSTRERTCWTASSPEGGTGELYARLPDFAGKASVLYAPPGAGARGRPGGPDRRHGRRPRGTGGGRRLGGQRARLVRPAPVRRLRRRSGGLC